ncbi:MAG TPA: hypothetical protein PK244_11210, partial [Pseudomonadales bacterium]|nr:hypothetical protein [Pseudomonadales bacterium]
MKELMSKTRTVWARVTDGDYPVRSNHRGNLVWEMDTLLLVITLALLCISWVMVSSASLDYATQKMGDTFYFAKRHGTYALMALM